MTIFALSSGPGVSGLAVIRISGPDTNKVIKLLTNSTNNLKLRIFLLLTSSASKYDII